MSAVVRRDQRSLVVECVYTLDAERVAKALLDSLRAVADELPSHEVRVEQNGRRVFVTGNLNHAEDALHVAADLDLTLPDLVFAETGISS